MKDNTENNLICGLSWEEIQQKQQGKNTGKTIKIEPGKDYGADPLGNGMFKMVPSGKIVSKEEKNKILDGK